MQILSIVFKYNLNTLILLHMQVTAYEAVKYTLENSEDQRCEQAMHSWFHTYYDQGFIWFYHLIVAKVLEVIASI